MSKATKRQVEITAEILGQAVANLNELEINYSLVVEGLDIIVSNTTSRHSLAILRDAIDFQDKLFEAELDHKIEVELDKESWGTGDSEEKKS